MYLKKGRIDSCELFSVMLFIAKGDYDLVLSSQIFFFFSIDFLFFKMLVLCLGLKIHKA